MRIGIVGGTGKQGGGLALRWARAGHAVVIGSRDAAKARARAAELAAAGHGAIEGGDNIAAARAAEVVVLTVPYAAHAETLRAIQPAMAGKVLIDVTVPLRPPKVSRVQLPPGRAAALEAQALLGPSTPVAAALHHVSPRTSPIRTHVVALRRPRRRRRRARARRSRSTSCAISACAASTLVRSSTRSRSSR